MFCTYLLLLIVFFSLLCSLGVALGILFLLGYSFLLLSGYIKVSNLLINFKNKIKRCLELIRLIANDVRFDLIQNKRFLFRNAILSGLIIVLVVPFTWHSITKNISTLFIGFKDSFVGEYCVLAYVICLLFWRFVMVKQSYKVSVKFVYLATFSNGIFLLSKPLLNGSNFYRFHKFDLCNWKVEFLEKFTYTGIVFGITLLFFWGGYLHQLLRKAIFSSLNQEQKSDLLSEDFLELTNHTTLLSHDKALDTRQPLANRLCDELLCIETNISYAVAILGQWGSGKTRFLKMIESSLKTNHSDDYILIKYYPWKVSGERAIISDFFTLLCNELQDYHGDINSAIDTYVEALLQNNKTLVAKLIKLLLGGDTQKTSVEEDYEKLSKVIEAISKKIIIIIDDLDRLDGDEIMGVMKLIRNVANFKNLIFIAAYDKNYISRRINNKLSEKTGETYLEKIFQLEITLPVFNPLHLQKLITSLLIDKFKDDWHSKRIRALTHARSLTWDYLQTIRDIIRFVNLFVIDYKSLEQEVDLFDFYHITLLKLKYTACYELIYQYRKRWFINNTNANKMVLLELQEAEKKEGDSSFLFEKEIKLLPSIIDNIRGQDLVIKTIKLLFEEFEKDSEISYDEYDFLNYKSQYPTLSSGDRVISINKKVSFYKYFSGHLRNNELSRSEFIRLFGWDDEKGILKKLNEWVIEGKEKYIQDYLKGFWEFPGIKEKEQYEKVIQILFKSNFLNLDEETLKVALLTEDNIGAIYGNNDTEYKNFIGQVLRNDSTIENPLMSNLTYHCKTMNHKSLFSLKELQEIYLYHLENYVKNQSIKDFEREHFLSILLEKYKNVQNPKGGYQGFVFDIYKDVNSILREVIKENPKEFLRSLFRKDEGHIVLRLGFKQEIRFFFNEYIEFYNFCQPIITANYSDDFYIGLKLFLEKQLPPREWNFNHAIRLISKGRLFYELKYPPVFVNFFNEEIEDVKKIKNSFSRSNDSIIWLNKEAEKITIPTLWSKDGLRKYGYIAIPKSPAWKDVSLDAGEHYNVKLLEIVEIDLGNLLSNSMPKMSYNIYRFHGDAVKFLIIDPFNGSERR